MLTVKDVSTREKYENLQNHTKQSVGREGHDRGYTVKTLLRHHFIVLQDRRSLDVLYGLQLKLKCATVHKVGGKMMAFQVNRKSLLENMSIPCYKSTDPKQQNVKVFVSYGV